jgi:hypothetical protein
MDMSSILWWIYDFLNIPLTGLVVSALVTGLVSAFFFVSECAFFFANHYV